MWVQSGKGVRLAVDVQMVEFIPSPDGLRDVIGIVAADVFHVAQVNDDVAGDGYSGDDLLRAAMTMR